MRTTLFCDITPCSLVEVHDNSGVSCFYLHASCCSLCSRLFSRGLFFGLYSSQDFLALPYLAYTSTTKMETQCSSETSADFYLTAWRHNPQASILQWNSCSIYKTAELHIIFPSAKMTQLHGAKYFFRIRQLLCYSTCRSVG
jgi:hypothetical protein